jgi:3-hydroxy-9,10-secoandrosta-1,3,5(10)-triene-9,17-dione monooxygenase reductase component
VRGVTDMPTSASSLDGARYRQVLGHFPTGVTVITAAGEGGPVGLCVGAFSSVSLDPPLVAFFAGAQSTSYPKIAAAGHYCVNILGEGQEEVARVFAGKAGDKFSGIGWRPSAATGAPVLDDVVAWIDCRIDAIHEAGDHWVVIGRVLDLDVGHEGGPLVFYRGGFGSYHA